MEHSFLPLTLDALDQATADSLCHFVAADERPLTGLAGLVDWRLTARLSRLLRAGQLTGEAGEAVLTSPGPRLGFRKMFLFGLGPSGQTEEDLQRRVGEALRKLGEAGVRDAAVQLPARLSAETAVRALLDGLQGPGRAIVFTPEPQKMISALTQVGRGQARLEQRTVKVPSPATAVSAAAVQEPPVAPAIETEPGPASPADGKKPAAAPPQRYVPAVPRQNVFKKKKR
jgi:leucyl aminopeptidase